MSAVDPDPDCPACFGTGQQDEMDIIEGVDRPCPWCWCGDDDEGEDDTGCGR